MHRPALSLEDVRRALDAQDREIEAACAALGARDGAYVLLPRAALERLRDACARRPPRAGAPRPRVAIRC